MRDLRPSYPPKTNRRVVEAQEMKAQRRCKRNYKSVSAESIVPVTNGIGAEQHGIDAARAACLAACRIYSRAFLLAANEHPCLLICTESRASTSYGLSQRRRASTCTRPSHDSGD